MAVNVLNRHNGNSGSNWRHILSANQSKVIWPNMLVDHGYNVHSPVRDCLGHAYWCQSDVQDLGSVCHNEGRLMNPVAHHQSCVHYEFPQYLPPGNSIRGPPHGIVRIGVTPDNENDTLPRAHRAGSPLRLELGGGSPPSMGMYVEINQHIPSSLLTETVSVCEFRYQPGWQVIEEVDSQHVACVLRAVLMKAHCSWWAVHRLAASSKWFLEEGYEGLLRFKSSLVVHWGHQRFVLVELPENQRNHCDCLQQWHRPLQTALLSCYASGPAPSVAL